MSENLETTSSGSDNPNQLELDLNFENDPSYWNFRVCRYKDESGTDVYGIHEVQYNVENKIVGYGEYPTEVFGSNMDDLKLGVEKLQEAFKKDVVELPLED